jgi:uncharacterized damage-inducible protein DinB
MATTTVQTEPATQTGVFTSAFLLKHWQGHRSLTRRVIEAFPEKELFTFSVGGMRPFSELAMEMIDMGGPGVVGAATDVWKKLEELDHTSKQGIPATKQALLEKWDEVTGIIESYWPQISAERLQEVALAFGLYENPVYQTIFYFIDNEIHHRGQGYVYLRALGIEPPPFWDRP